MEYFVKNSSVDFLVNLIVKIFIVKKSFQLNYLAIISLFLVCNSLALYLKRVNNQFFWSLE
jgi:hypothetical protein